MLPRLWGFEGTTLWRRHDGRMYAFGEWCMARSQGGIYEASDEEDWGELYEGGSYGGGEEEGEEEASEDEDDMSSFIDDDSELGSEDDSEEEGEEEEAEEAEAEEGEEEEEDSEEAAHGWTSPEGSEEGFENEEGGAVLRASCLLEGDWEPRAQLRIDCLSDRTPTVTLWFELRGDRVERWAKVRKMLDALRWG